MANYLFFDCFSHCQENLMNEQSNSSVMLLNDEAPRSGSNQWDTGEERRAISSSDLNEADGSKPTGSLFVDEVKSGNVRSFLKTHRVGTWNVRSMAQGKLEVVKSEMARTKTNILGISELRWSGMGHFQSDAHKVFYSGGQDHRRNGVAAILDNVTSGYVMGYNPVSDRVISIRLRGKPYNMTLVQVYAPTTSADEHDIEDFYETLQHVLDETPNSDVTVILGDFNAKVGKEIVPEAVGGFGLGIRNDAGDRLVDFCVGNQLTISNTLFMQPERRLYTWLSPGDLYRNQIDYILIRNRWRSAIQTCKTLPSADCGTDHQLLIADIRVRLKKLPKRTTPIRYKLDAFPPAFNVEVRNRFEVLMTLDAEPEEIWEEVRNTYSVAAGKHLEKREKRGKTKWMSDRTMETAAERRRAKARGQRSDMVQLNRRFQREVREDKENFLNAQCDQVEQFQDSGKSREMFAKIREITGSFQPRFGIVRDTNGKDITTEEGVKRRWKEYTELLYQRDLGVGCSFVETTFAQEPTVLRSEVEWALNQLSNNKSPGVDNIPIEMLKATMPASTDILTKLCQSIWDSLIWPSQWKESVFVPLLKKGDPRECSNYRTIALITHTSKVLLKVLQRRLEPYLEREAGLEQAGFRRNRGTRDHICNLRWIMETTREYNRDLYICFIDYSKAFDCVDYEKLWCTLREMGVPEHLIMLVRSLYTAQEAKVRTEFGMTDAFPINKGVRQGCILSPGLFSLYAEAVMRKVADDEDQMGIRIGGRRIWNLRYADDTTLIAESVEHLQELIRRVKRHSAEAGLHLNLRKTKVMSTAELETFILDDEPLEIVSSYVFLGTSIESTGGCGNELRKRLCMGRRAMSNLTDIMKEHDVSRATKIRLVESMVFPVAMYGSESWTPTKIERKRVDAFEMWCWRRVLRIPWTARKTNSFVISQIRPHLSLEARILKHRLTFFGHVMRTADSLEKSLMLSKVEGTRKRGRPRRRWMDVICEATGKTLSELRHLTINRQGWREFVREVTRSRHRLDGT